jgi:hypothetical protein
MRIEIILFFITGLVVAHIYSEGKYIQLILKHKKYVQIAGVLVGAWFMYWMIRKNPASTKDWIQTGKKYLPIDPQMRPWIDPFIDNITQFGNGGTATPLAELPPGVFPISQKTKRAVTESMKKIVASRQEWKCKSCNHILDHTYQIDHIKRLQFGGTNDLTNLQALCPNCHSSKTVTEIVGGGGGGL